MNERYVKTARSYAIAASLTALALLIRGLAAPWAGSHFRLTLLYGAVALAVRYGGAAPGVLAAAGGYVAANYLFPAAQSPSILPLATTPRAVAELVIYATSCTIIIILAAALRRARQRTADDTAALRASEERFRVAVESAALPFSILESVRDDGGRIIDFKWQYMNSAAARTVRRPAAELLGRRVGQLVPSSWEAPGLLDAYRRAADTREPQTIEVRTRLDGVDTWLHNIATRFGDGVAVWSTDVTASRKAELTLLDADRRKDEFLAVLAHELRNPLAPMRNALEILHLRSPDEPFLGHARAIIDRQLLHLSRLVDDLLDLSRVTQGRIQLQRVRVALSVVVAHAVEVGTPMIEQGGHHLEVSLPREPVFVDGDITRLAQIIGNLLNNAAKYTPAGGHIKLAVVHDGSEARIDVQDDGVGIPADMLPHIFEMFVQVNPSLDRTQGGLGIGLTLVSRLAAMHGGRVEAQSGGLGKGSTFSVHLPVALEPASEHAPSVEPPVPAPHRRVLIVDDNVDAAESLSMLLGTLGHETRLAHDGEQALALVQTFNPEVVLLDIGLPHVNGYEVARRIRRGTAGGGPHLIALTGWGQEEDRRLAREAGFDHHVTKPVELSVLSGLIACERAF